MAYDSLTRLRQVLAHGPTRRILLLPWLSMRQPAAFRRDNESVSTALCPGYALLTWGNYGLRGTASMPQSAREQMAVSNRVRITDVAARAGVGVGTVSRVLNGSPQVRESTRFRVLETIEQVRYRPSRLAADDGLGFSSTSDGLRGGAHGAARMCTLLHGGSVRPPRGPLPLRSRRPAQHVRAPARGRYSRSHHRAERAPP